MTEDLQSLYKELEFYETLRDAIEDALLQGSSQLEISIAGRSVKYRSFSELIQAKQFTENEIYRLKRAIALVEGENIPSNKIRTRFIL